MGAITSRQDHDGLGPASHHHGRRRGSQMQDIQLYNYSLSKNHFSNFFFMGGERFEVNDPDYLFGDNCDLNFLSCIKPYSLPYRKAQQNLLSNLNSKQKAINKASSRVNGLGSPFDILARRHRHASQSRKQDAQTQTLQNCMKGGLSNGPEPSQPLVMLVNIRKETLRLVRSTNFCTIDSSDQNSLTNTNINLNETNSSVSTKSGGYTSVKDVLHGSDSVSFANDDDDDDFQDALNETTHLSANDDDDESEHAQQHNSLLPETKKSTKDTSDNIEITIRASDDTTTSITSNTDDNSSSPVDIRDRMAGKPTTNKSPQATNNRVYNIEFYFDSEVDCSIRIFYFSTREISSSGVTYKPQHATYKSKTYTFKKGLNQKFEQQEHTFQPHLFDEDLLIYKPLDLEGNYNSGAVFPIVIHCVALEGPMPRQSYSLVATVEKSQLDDSYSIKPLKQLIYVDGIQYILQDIYGIENKRLPPSPTDTTDSMTANSRSQASTTTNLRHSSSRNLRASCSSLRSNFSIRSTSMNDRGDNSSMHSYDTTSSIGDGVSGGSRVRYRVSVLNGNRYRSLGGENSFECVICMSEERDTMLLPCRHLCLCSSCAQSLRYQANSCPICRCPFKAALSLRLLEQRRQQHHYQQQQRRLPGGATGGQQQQQRRRKSWQTTTMGGEADSLDGKTREDQTSTSSNENDNSTNARRTSTGEQQANISDQDTATTITQQLPLSSGKLNSTDR